MMPQLVWLQLQLQRYLAVVMTLEGPACKPHAWQHADSGAGLHCAVQGGSCRSLHQHQEALGASLTQRQQAGQGDSTWVLINRVSQSQQIKLYAAADEASHGACKLRRVVFRCSA